MAATVILSFASVGLRFLPAVGAVVCFGLMMRADWERANLSTEHALADALLIEDVSLPMHFDPVSYGIGTQLALRITNKSKVGVHELRARLDRIEMFTSSGEWVAMDAFTPIWLPWDELPGPVSLSPGGHANLGLVTQYVHNPRHALPAGAPLKTGFALSSGFLRLSLELQAIGNAAHTVQRNVEWQTTRWGADPRLEPAVLKFGNRPRASC